MKRAVGLLTAVLFCLLSGCGSVSTSGGDAILATTYPMYYLTARLTEGMDVTVDVMVAEAVSCLHDYTLTTEQMKKIERADLLVMNGGELEEFMDAALARVPEEDRIVAEEDLDDPHFWLSPLCYRDAAENIAGELISRYPAQTAQIESNLSALQAELSELQTELYGLLADLSCRELITFHDGFYWFADAFDLTIAAAVEEEEGAEASAAELREICRLIDSRNIPAIFKERNGPSNAASIISRETGVEVYTLNTMMDGQTDYFTAMRENAAAVREALS